MTTTERLEMSATTIAEDIAKRLEAAWNAADGAAYARPFAADADFVNVRGELHTSRAAIAAGHDGIFRSIYAGSTNTMRVLQARELDGGAILVHLRSELSVPGGPLAGEHSATGTALLVPAGDGHEIAAFHNTLVAA